MVRRFLGVKHIEIKCHKFEEISSYDLDNLECGDFIIYKADGNEYKFSVVQKGNSFITAIYQNEWGTQQVEFLKDENGKWAFHSQRTINTMEMLYINENGYEPSNEIDKTTSALLIYACKKDSNSPIVGGTLPLYNNNTMLLFSEDGDELKVITTDLSGGKEKVEVEHEGMSYYRVMIVKMPIFLPPLPTM